MRLDQEFKSIKEAKKEKLGIKDVFVEEEDE